MTDSVLDKSLGIHQHAVRVRSQRSAVLAANIANADTPNYKAKDIAFNDVLRRAAGKNTSLSLQTTRSGHMGPGDVKTGAGDIKFRQPLQPSLDGNTVDDHIEHVQFAENTFRYQASLQFLSSKFKSLQLAIKGE